MQVTLLPDVLTFALGEPERLSRSGGSRSCSHIQALSSTEDACMLAGMSALSQWLDRRQPSASVVQAIAASAVGLLAGAGVRLFRWLIEWVRDLWSTGLAPLGPAWSTALMPVLGGVIVGLLLLWLVGEERHH